MLNTKEGERPSIFLSHRGTDKPRLEAFVMRVISDGVSVVVDNTTAFTMGFIARIAEFERRGLFRTFRGGVDWQRQAREAIETCDCTICMLSFQSSDPRDPDVGAVQHSEISAAFGRKRLVIVELDAGAAEQFFARLQLDPERLKQAHYLPFQPAHFDRDIYKIGEAAAKLSGGRVSFGQGLSGPVLSRLQDDLAMDLKGSKALKSILNHDFGQPLHLQLVPSGQPPGTSYFWFTTRPLFYDPVDIGTVRTRLVGMAAFRLPSAAEAAWALAPLGFDSPDKNPFGLASRLRQGIWTRDIEPAILGGDPQSSRALLHLIYER